MPDYKRTGAASLLDAFPEISNITERVKSSRRKKSNEDIIAEAMKDPLNEVIREFDPETGEVKTKITRKVADEQKQEDFGKTLRGIALDKAVELTGAPFEGEDDAAYNERFKKNFGMAYKALGGIAVGGETGDVQPPARGAGIQPGGLGRLAQSASGSVLARLLGPFLKRQGIGPATETANVQSELAKGSAAKSSQQTYSVGQVIKRKDGDKVREFKVVKTDDNGLNPEFEEVTASASTP